MKLIFNDATELQIQQASIRVDGALCIKIIGESAAELTNLFMDEVKTTYMVVQDNNRTVAEYDRYTAFYGIEILNGGILEVHNYQVGKSLEERVDAVEESANATGIAFVTLAEAEMIDGTTAGEHASLFEEWSYPIAYTVGQIRRYNDALYKCVQAHTSQEDWTPDVSVSLWTNIADPAEEWPEWSQPIGAHDAYQNGDKVSHNDKHWISDIDNNVYEPGVYGWTEA